MKKPNQLFKEKCNFCGYEAGAKTQDRVENTIENHWTKCGKYQAWFKRQMREGSRIRMKREPIPQPIDPMGKPI